MGDGKLHGNDLDNSLTGNSGADTLQGVSGDDVLDGQSGSDTMAWWSGNDTLVIDTLGDLFRESSGGGSDLVLSPFDYTLPSATANGFIENLRLLDEFGNLDGSGNSITGNSGDTLFGGGGNDWFLFGANLGANDQIIRDFRGNFNGGQDKLVFKTCLEVRTFDYRGGSSFSTSGESEARYAGAKRWRSIKTETTAPTSSSGSPA